MAQITFKGKMVNTVGNLPKVGSVSPEFTLTRTDLSELNSTELKGNKVILSIFPSLDTDVCANAMRKFNERANKVPDVKVLCISADLPFAHKRFCEVENLNNVIPVSIFRHPEFGKDFGVTITEGPLAGLLSRAVVILDGNGHVIYTQQV